MRLVTLAQYRRCVKSPCTARKRLRDTSRDTLVLVEESVHGGLSKSVAVRYRLHYVVCDKDADLRILISFVGRCTDMHGRQCLFQIGVIEGKYYIDMQPWNVIVILAITS
jgi:hypothetical protein